ncbi:tetratricopeptide repeat protein [Hymenobacter sp. J193]|uniref:tetratricopeptide repeat protein n=1 Tax=Hymenobacter sp. J193 TaxID=2898429 RepID=UPI0021509A42|nr:tetratricopeptide repeat protein [Hymenobacter sp. J193]MCR5889724.1 tetratricopeptide repeat protein [Hymenobacter sp. J193]
MRSVLVILLVISTWGGLTGIRVRNEAVQAGTRAYRAHRYAAAVQHYQRALAAVRRPDEALELNLAHAAWQANQPVLARAYYSRLLNSSSGPLRSVAQQQLGVLQARRGDYAQAARLLRQALLTNPRNATARYNYEAVMRYLARRPDPETPPPASPTPPTRSATPTSSSPNPRPATSRAGS